MELEVVCIKKWRLLMTVFFSIMTFLLGCGNEAIQMTKVVFIETHEDGSYGAEITISEEKKLDDLESMFKEVKWEKSIPSMGRKEDVLVKVTYENKKQNVEYNIWFNQNGKAELLSSDMNEGYGRLNKDTSKSLLKVLLNK